MKGKLIQNLFLVSVSLDVFFLSLKILIMIVCVTATLLISYFLSCHWTFSLISSCSLFLILFSSSFQLYTSKYRPCTIRCHCFHIFSPHVLLMFVRSQLQKLEHSDHLWPEGRNSEPYPASREVSLSIPRAVQQDREQAAGSSISSPNA